MMMLLIFFPFFLRCVFLYNPNFFQMLPTPPFQIFVIFFFLFYSGREEEEEEEDYDVCVCVCTPFLPCFMKGFVLLLPAPLSFVDSLFIPEERTRQRRLVYSFFFSFPYVYKQKLEREREVVLFFSLFLFTCLCTQNVLQFFAGCRRKSWYTITSVYQRHFLSLSVSAWLFISTHDDQVFVWVDSADSMQRRYSSLTVDD